MAELKREMRAAVAAARAGDARDTPKLERALEALLDRKEGNDKAAPARPREARPTPKPKSHWPSDDDDDDSDSPSPVERSTKENDPPKDFFRRAARRAYGRRPHPPVEIESIDHKERRTLHELLARCSDAKAAAELVETRAPGVLRCARAKLWVMARAADELLPDGADVRGDGPSGVPSGNRRCVLLQEDFSTHAVQHGKSSHARTAEVRVGVAGGAGTKTRR